MPAAAMPVDIALPTSTPVPRLWDEVAAALCRHAQAHGLPLQDVLLLLPYAAPLGAAREALARASAGWLPQVQTPLTLAQALGPADDAGPGGHAPRDHLAALGLMRGVAPLRQWEQDDPLAFAQAVPAVVAAAAELRRLCLLQPPAARPAWWQQAQVLISAAPGPGAWEALLAQVALAWARHSPPPPEDRLWALRPAAWATVVLGGQPPLLQALLDHAAGQGQPVLRLWADPLGDVLADLPEAPNVTRLRSTDAEEEAWATAATVLQAVGAGQVPVVLVAEDRLLIRRVRALLERRGLPLHDETGWALSTTQAAARVMAWLRAATPLADADTLLAAWKLLLAPRDAAALQALEGFWRGGHGRDGAGPQAEPPPGPAQALWQRERQRLAPWRAHAVRPLAQWLALLRDTLDSTDTDPAWAHDPAARQVRGVLGLDALDAPGEPLPLSLPAFTAWVEQALAQAVYLPPVPAGAPVVVTPLARAIGRPFAAAVLPGTDARWALPPPQATLLSPAQWQALGQPGRLALQQQRLAALRQLLRVPAVTLLRRAAEGDEALGPSAWVQLLLPSCPEHGVALPGRPVPPEPVHPPQPVAAGALPAQLSASTLQALRDCPYRFFSRAVLRLREHEELEREAATRDYGNWLHGVLHRFHEGRGEPADAATEVQRLLALADEALAQDPLLRGLDQADLLPYRAGLPELAQRYVAWLHGRDAAGWHYLAGEAEHQAAPPELPGTRLHGRIDRMDLHAAGPLQVLDYKAGSPATLKRKAAGPLEDVQLVFYAALLAGHPQAAGRALQAAYLPLEQREALAELPCAADPGAAAQVLLQGLAGEWQRLREGATLPALGQGPVCEHCEARGLCRRDHWSELP